MGFPIEAYEKMSPTMSLDEFVLGSIQASFMCTVESSEMQSEGIFPGDYLIIERTANAKKRHIVIVVEDGIYTMKHAQDLKITDRIEAVVRAVIRKYE
jgi:DNA polymerase V